MNNIYKETLKWIIMIGLIYLVINYSILSYGSFTALGAHEKSERTSHYGPSEIIEEIDLKGTKIYLCKYEDFISADYVHRGFIKWNSKGNYILKIDKSEKITYCNGSPSIKNTSVDSIFGYVSDPNIKQIALIVKENEKTIDLECTVDENSMFILYWDRAVRNHDYEQLTLIGYDENGKILYQKE